MERPKVISRSVGEARVLVVTVWYTAPTGIRLLMKAVWWGADVLGRRYTTTGGRRRAAGSSLPIRAVRTSSPDRWAGCSPALRARSCVAREELPARLARRKSLAATDPDLDALVDYVFQRTDGSLGKNGK